MAAAREDESIYLISRRDGKPNSQAGISTMTLRHGVVSGVRDFAPYHTEAKRATDVGQDGVPIDEISALCGDNSITTTEKFIGQHRKKSVKPNAQKIAGAA